MQIASSQHRVTCEHLFQERKRNGSDVKASEKKSETNGRREEDATRDRGEHAISRRDCSGKCPNDARLALALTLTAETLHSHWRDWLGRSRLLHLLQRPRERVRRRVGLASPVPHSPVRFANRDSALSIVRFWLLPGDTRANSTRPRFVTGSVIYLSLSERASIVRRCTRYLTDNKQTSKLRGSIYTNYDEHR